MRSRILTSMLFTMLLGGSPAAMAFDLKKLNLGDSNASTPASNNAAAAQEQLIGKYTNASAKITVAQKELAYAFGLKDQAAALEAQAVALQSGATLDKDAIKKQKKLSEDADAAIQDKIASGAELSAEGRQHYLNSLSPFAEGVSLTSKMPNELKSFSDAAQTQIKNGSVVDKLNATSSLSTGLYLVQELPGYTTRMLDSLGKVVTYAKKQNVQVPKDATDALGSL